jgi:hypothetical protein
VALKKKNLFSTFRNDAYRSSKSLVLFFSRNPEVRIKETEEHRFLSSLLSTEEQDRQMMQKYIMQKGREEKKNTHPLLFFSHSIYDFLAKKKTSKIFFFSAEHLFILVK